MTAQQLADVCRELGYEEITAQALSNIESGRRNTEGERRRYVTVDELMALAVALQVAPVYLLVPPLPDAAYPLPIDAHEQLGLSHVWQRFIRGERPLPGMDEQLFLSEVPREEFTRLLNRLASESKGEDDG